MADGHRITMSQLRPLSGKPIQIRRFVRTPAVTAENLSPDIVREDEHDVRTIGRPGKCRGGDEYRQESTQNGC